MKKIILVVEDDDDFFLSLVAFIKNEDSEIMRASTLEEGKKIFFENQEKINLIIMDACVPGQEPNSMPLIEEIIKSGFSKHIVGLSSSFNYLFKLRDAGATNIISKSDLMVIRNKIFELLEL